uniref:SAM domain-containing protein n=1 Tax=Hippocampus comes TaxID=109280 RepID=A0A3Q2Y6I8_HIPCM
MAHQWVSSGETLLSATAQDLEKVPMRARARKSAELDYLWVTRWLDDIGLPQYKDQFNEGRVDGQMLQYLTVNDLLALKVTSQLHHLSIKCAIHVLHVNQFNPYCLKRRPGTENQCSPREVVQWSNHRVMEWLRSVDLAEYAPNLRGSGVHGGLIMLEPRFNSDSLAMLLNIPPQKTLLRRHLATNFSNLVGAQAQQEKREYTEAVNSTPLKAEKKKQINSHFIINHYCLCMHACVLQMGITRGTMLQIEALSERINNMTVSNSTLWNFYTGKNPSRHKEGGGGS